MSWSLRITPIFLLAMTVLFALADAVSAEDRPGTPTDAAQVNDVRINEVRTVVEKAIPYIKNEGVRWMEKRGCVSCHQVPAMLWSLSVAHDRGFDVDRKDLAKWNEWSVDVVNFVKPEQKKDVDHDKTMSANIDTMSALMFAITPTDADGNWRTKFAKALTENQQDDGSWKACGQLPMQKRPKDETNRVTSAWTYLSLLRHANPALKPDDQVLAFIDSGPQAKSTEWWAVRKLLASHLGDSAQEQKTRAKLLASQNDDGGWGWIGGQSSDALATGLVLYSLSQTPSTKTASPTILAKSLSSSTQFLVSTQKENGSWSVPGTKTSAQGKATATSNYWGTAWAVIGLLEHYQDAGPITE